MMKKGLYFMCIAAFVANEHAHATQRTPQRAKYTLQARAVAAKIASSPTLTAQVRKDAANGSPLAQDALGYLAINGLSVRPDPAAAIKAFAPGVKAGRPAALNGIIEAYLHLGPTRDPARAYTYATQLARISPDGLATQGLLTLKGWGVKQNTTQGMSLLAQAVNKGSAAGDYFTYVAYTDGTAGRKDPKLAQIYFSSALQKNYSQAYLVYGQQLIKGQGTPQNVALGYKYLNNAMRMGEGQAPELLSHFLVYPPFGYSPDYPRALKAAAPCAAAGSAMCNYLMGVTLPATGTPRTAPKVLAYLKAASTQGHPQAIQRYMETITRLNSPEDAAIARYALTLKFITSAKLSAMENAARLNPDAVARASATLQRNATTYRGNRIQ